jgi:hypothetical protein
LRSAKSAAADLLRFQLGSGAGELRSFAFSAQHQNKKSASRTTATGRWREWWVSIALPPLSLWRGQGRVRRQSQTRPATNARDSYFWPSVLLPKRISPFANGFFRHTSTRSLYGMSFLPSCLLLADRAVLASSSALRRTTPIVLAAIFTASGESRAAGRRLLRDF